MLSHLCVVTISSHFKSSLRVLILFTHNQLTQYKNQIRTWLDYVTSNESILEASHRRGVWSVLWRRLYDLCCSRWCCDCNNNVTAVWGLRKNLMVSSLFPLVGGQRSRCCTGTHRRRIRTGSTFNQVHCVAADDGAAAPLRGLLDKQVLGDHSSTLWCWVRFYFLFFLCDMINSDLIWHKNTSVSLHLNVRIQETY